MKRMLFTSGTLALVALGAAGCSNWMGGSSNEPAMSGSSAAPGIATTAVASPYDGVWMVDAPAAGPGYQGQSTCPPLRLEFRVRGNQVTGSYARSPENSTLVENSQGAGAAPLTGTVQPDGTINTEWQGYHVTGQLTGSTAHLHWTGACGPRNATGSRISA